MSSLRRWVRCAAAALLLAAGAAQACPICVPSAGPSIVQSLSRADTVLLVGHDAGSWRTLARVKGAAPDSLTGLAAEPPPAGMALVVLRETDATPWRSLGAMPPAQADWLQALVRQGADPPVTPVQWQAYLALLQPALGAAAPFMAAVADDEIARAPYAEMRGLKPRLDARQLIRWLDDPSVGMRASLYTLLLGIAGGAEASARIDGQIARAARLGDTTDLSARLVADLEMRPARVRWIEQTYLLDPRRSLQEVQAALLALSVQGQADGAVARSRVVQSYRAFIRSGHPLAGYVAPDLAAWKDDSAVPDALALLKRGVRQQPASMFALLMYLEQSSRPEAREAARAFRARAER